MVMSLLSNELRCLNGTQSTCNYVEDSAKKSQLNTLYRFANNTVCDILLSHYSLGRVIKTVQLLKPSRHVMHQQINIQQLYALPTLYLCVLYLSENKQRLMPLTA